MLVKTITTYMLVCVIALGYVLSLINTIGGPWGAWGARAPLPKKKIWSGFIIDKQLS